MPSSILLIIRWRQARKELRGIGLVYALVLLVLVCLASAYLYGQFGKAGTAWFFSGLIVFSVLSVQIGRRDKAFVALHMEQPVLSLYLEYLVLTLPFTAPVVATPYWYLFPVMQGCFYGIAHIRATPAKKTWLQGLSRFIAPRDFEWLAGMRQAGFLVLFLYVTALTLSWLIVAPLVCLWLITVRITSFYLECEPLALLWSNADTPARLLRGKIKRHVRLLLLLLLPVLILHTLLCPAMVWVNLAFLVLQVLLLVFAILLKYTTYTPGTLITGNNILMGLAAVSIAIPFLLPIPLLMSIRNYGRALRQLKTYTYDPDS